jgi:hypothetical protein
MLGDALSKALLLVLACLWLAVLVALGLHGWRQGKDWTQIAVLLAAAQGLLGALLVYVAGRGGDPGPILAVAILLAFAAALLAWLLLAGGFWTERRRGAAILALLLVLLSIALAVLVGTIDDLASPLTQTLSDPRAYAGPAGWLLGCAPKTVIVEKETAIEETVVVEKKVEKVVKETVIVEVEKQVTQVVEKEATQVVVETLVAERSEAATATPAPQRSPTTYASQATHATPTALLAEPAAPAATPPPPTRAAGIAATATPARPAALPPPLLGQFNPETLYWAPEAITDKAGRLDFEVPLPDTPATWRLTILASTQQGELGAAETALTAKP